MKNQLIKINGFDVTSYRISTEIEKTMEDETDKVIIDFSKSILNGLNISTFQEVLIYENYSGTLEQSTNRIFKGVISKIEKDPLKIRVTAFCELWKAVQTEVNKTYDKNIDSSIGVGSEIFKNLCDLAGLLYDDTTIINTGNLIVLDKFVCNRAEVFERMKTLADIYGYQIFYNSQEDKVHFEPLGYSINSNIIYIGGVNNNVQNLSKWKIDGTKLFNKIEVIGAYQEVQSTQYFSGDGINTSFKLNEMPEIVRIEVGGIEKIGGTEGATSNFDYLVSKDQKEIDFTNAPATGTNNIMVRYSYRAPRPVVISNPTSITQIGRTIKRRFTFNDIQKVNDAETRARELLNVYSSPFLSTKIKIKPNIVNSLNLDVGQIIEIIDNRYSYDEQMLIRKMKINYPKNDIELTVGNKEVKIGDLERDTTIRLKRLEEELSKSGNFIVEVLDFSNSVNAKNRYIKIEKRIYNVANNIGIYGNSKLGIYGTSIYGTEADAWNAYEIKSIKQYNNYIEDFRDTDFKDSQTTANWDTANKQLNFLGNQIAQSSSIDLNNQTILNAKIEITGNGNFDIYLTSDGVNWEIVSNNVLYTFINTGTDLRWKIIENAGLTAQITKIEISKN